MRRDVEPTHSMTPRKRQREVDNTDVNSLPLPKHHCSQLEPSLPTPSPTAPSPKHDDPRPQRDKPLPKARKAREQSRRASPQSEPDPPKRPFEEDADCDPARESKRRRKAPPACGPRAITPRPTEPQGSWFLNHWLKKTPGSRTVQEKTGRSDDVIPSIEGTEGRDVDSTTKSAIRGGENPNADPGEGGDLLDTIQGLRDSPAISDPMSQQQDVDNSQPSESGQSERLNTSSPMFRATLKIHGIVIDNMGRKIPQEVLELVTKYIRKERKSPRLGEEEVDRIVQKIEDVWDSAEPLVLDVIALLFPVDAAGLAEGRDTLWSTAPLPRRQGYPYLLPKPKTDRHFGYPTTLKSDWSFDEFVTMDHPRVRSYSYATRHNVFPSFLIEVKAEATNGTNLYGAEGQLATAGAHRVLSLLWILDQIDPDRKRSCTDSLVFSAAVSQRQAVAHVHFYHPEQKMVYPEQKMVYMCYIDDFSLVKDVQKTRDFSKNVRDWLLDIQQETVRETLRRLHPIAKLWKKGRTVSAAADPSESFGSEAGRSSKSQRLE